MIKLCSLIYKIFNKILRILHNAYCADNMTLKSTPPGF